MTRWRHSRPACGAASPGVRRSSAPRPSAHGTSSCSPTFGATPSPAGTAAVLRGVTWPRGSASCARPPVPTEQPVAWDIWNEPNDPGFWSGGRRRFFDVYARANRVLREELGPGVEIGGPSISRYAPDWLADFLDRCLIERCRLDFLSWHENLEPSDPLELDLRPPFRRPAAVRERLALRPPGHARDSHERVRGQVRPLPAGRGRVLSRAAGSAAARTCAAARAGHARTARRPGSTAS